MTETAENTTRNWGDLNTPLIITVGLVGAILVLGVIIPGVKALVYNAENQRLQETSLNQTYPDLTAYQQEETAILQGQAAWVNKEQGVARIDIDTAMRLYAERQGK